MNLFRHAVASILVIGSLVSPAFAQGETPDSTFGENTMTFTTPGGAMMKRMVPANVMNNMMTKGAMPMTDGVMMMMHQGKMYMMHDQKMPDGKMMSDVAMGK